VESYILDFDRDLYGQQIGVEFIARLRGMERFDGVEALTRQMSADVDRTRRLLS